MKKLNDELDSRLENILADLPNMFDSHDFINRLIEKFNDFYEELLLEYKKAKDPTATLHSRIGMYLSRLSRYGKILKKLQADGTPELNHSLNIKGYKSYNHVWIKNM